MSAMPLAEAEDAFVIGDQQTSAVDSGRYEQPIRRVTVPPFCQHSSIRNRVGARRRVSPLSSHRAI